MGMRVTVVILKYVGTGNKQRCYDVMNVDASFLTWEERS